jgi:methionyl-tRNA synthetase
VPERYFQTTPIFYVNDRPHLGTAYTMIVADALARWHRLIGDDVLFLTGLDEHGLKIARSAEEHGVSPKEWVDQASVWFLRAWADLGITQDDFIRTTDERHTTSVAKFVQAIFDNGFIYKGDYAGWYCVSCENYYVESDLLEGGLCPIHETPAEWVTEENYFFALSKFQDRLTEWYERNPTAVLPESRRNEALGLIRQGLTDFSISRTSFDWGIPVPWDDRHVFYVWFEALMNYTSAVGYGADQEYFDKWWPVAHHLIGKDIVKFHCVWWPAMCMAAGVEPPAGIVAHGFLLVGGRKMGKSQANHVDPVELANDVGLDPLRYHILRDVTLGLDGDFTYEGLIDRYNADLANNLGNLLQRVSTLVNQKCGGIGPKPSGATQMRAAVETEIPEIKAEWRATRPHAALARTWTLIGAANAALEIAEPWKLEPGPEVDAVLGDALEVLRIVAVLASPAIPSSAAQIWRRIGLPGGPAANGAAGPDGVLSWGGYPGGLPVERTEPLFPRRRLEEAVE